MKLALLGCGTVGSEVVRLMRTRGEELAARVGEPVEIAGIAVRRAGRDRSHLPVDPSLFTTDAFGLIKRDDVDIVVEVAGGIEPARSWITAALGEGKSVVTANKALLAEDMPALAASAKAGGADLYYEAAAAAAIPLMRPLRESLHGDTINQVLGIVNGTTNFILSQMSRTGAGFGEALAEATELGYAEADPTADVDGYDAAAKAALIASLAFHTHVDLSEVHREGIANVTQADIASAAAENRVVKPLCIASREDDGVSVRVHPAMIPATHPSPTSTAPTTRCSSRPSRPGGSCSTAPEPGYRDRLGRARRYRCRSAQQARRHHGVPARGRLLRPAGETHRRGPHPIPRQSRRRRRARRARPRGGHLRPQRCQPRDRPPGRAGRRGPARSRHAHRRRPAVGGHR
ncbi:hypothetical protein GCM10029992_29380 [Glycomyces albus]